MHIGLTNVFIKPPSGFVLPLTDFDAAWRGEISTNGADVNVKYNFGSR